MRRYYYGRRRNGDVNALIALVESMGQDRLAMLMRKYASDPDVAPMLAQVADHVLGVPEPEPVVEPARMTDAQAWYALADLVPSALSSLSTEYQSALINAFRDEAAKAA